MPRIKDISKYPLDNNITPSDIVIGSDNENNGKTKNYSVGGLGDFFAEYISVVVSGTGDRILSGNVFPLDSATLTFGSTPIRYAFQNTYNIAPARNLITLTAPSAGNKRIDVFVVDTDTNTVTTVTGTEGSSPQEPVIDFRSELKITTVLLDENGIVNLNVEQVYDENVGEPDEWTITETEVGGGTFDPNNATDPSVGSKSILCSNLVDGNILTFTNDVVMSRSVDSIFMRLKNDSVEDLNINVTLLNGGLVVNSLPVNIINGRYGYNISEVSSYVYVNIPINEFGLTGDFDTIRLSFNPQSADVIERLYIDDVRIIEGIEMPSAQIRWTDLTDTDNSYDGKRGYMPMVTSLEDGLKLIDSSRFLLVSDFYTGNAVLDPRVIALGGMNYRILASKFIINNVFYNEPVSTDVTLADGDGSFDRIDTFYIQKTDIDTAAFGGVAQGTPSADPQEETLEPNQAKVAIKIVATGETATDVVTEQVYEDGDGEPTEWNISGTGANVNPTYAVDSDSGTNNLLMDANDTVGDADIIFTNLTSVTYNASDILALRMKLADSWRDGVYLTLYLSDGSDNTTTVTLTSDNLASYGFDNSLVDEWQDVVIRLSEFVGLSSFTQLYMSINNRTGLLSTAYFDNIRFQSGIINEDPDNAGLQDLQSVLDEGGYAESPDGSSYIYINMQDGASGYFDLWFQNPIDGFGGIYVGSTEAGIYAEDETGDGGQLYITSGDAYLQRKVTGNISSFLRFITPTVNGHQYFIPARTDGATSSNLAIGLFDGSATVYAGTNGVINASALNLAGTLQQTTDAGNSSTNEIIVVSPLNGSQVVISKDYIGEGGGAIDFTEESGVIYIANSLGVKALLGYNLGTTEARFQLPDVGFEDDNPQTVIPISVNGQKPSNQGDISLVGANDSGVTELDLTNVVYTVYDTDVSPNSHTGTYTVSAQVVGGKAKVYINAASEPSVDGSTKVAGSPFSAATLMIMYVEYDGVRRTHWFEAL